MPKVYLSLRTLGSATLAMALAAPTLAATTYRVTPLDVGIYDGAYVNGIGATGAIVGQVFSGVVYASPAMWNNAGQLIDLSPGLAGNIGAFYAVGVDRNERVALYVADAPYLWANGTLTPLDLGPLGGGIVTMNDVGQILISTASSGAYVWSNGVVSSSGVGIIPNDLNNNGDVAGRRNPTGTKWQASIWSNGTTTDLDIFPGETETNAISINDAKHVAGSSYSSSLGQSHAFFWKDGVRAELVGFAGSTEVSPTGINNADQIVGNARFGTQTIIPLLWENGVVTDLSAVIGQHGEQCNAIGINDAGQISACTYRLTPVSSGADLGVMIKLSTTNIAVGDTFNYTVKVANAGAEAVTGAVLTDTLPAGVTLISTTASKGTCNGSTTVVCTLGDFIPGASATVQLTVKATAAGILSNNASVTRNETDVNFVNDTARLNVNVTAPPTTADLGVTMTDSPDPVKRRSNLTYSIVAKNYGSGNASSVVVTDTIPSSMSFVSARTTQGSCTGSATITCSLGSLANGASGTVTIVVQPRTEGTYSNKATITSSTADNNSANNTATVTTQVR